MVLLGLRETSGWETGSLFVRGAQLGEGSVAGANAVVTADVPPFTLVAGVPARAIRRYDPDLKLWVQV